MNSSGKIAIGLAALAVAVGGGFAAERLGRRAVEQVVHDYILAHPEILPQAMEELQRRQDEAQLSGMRAQVEKPFPGAVLGNPQGKVTLVEFSDFACTFCRQSEADIERLIAGNPDLRVVVHQLPVIGPQSPAAARMALAAARQGKYAAFHSAMFAAGQPTPETIEAVARAVGLDMARAKADAADPAIEAELQRNIELANKLGFTGTPSWVAGKRLLSGAVGYDQLAGAVASIGK